MEGARNLRGLFSPSFSSGMTPLRSPAFNTSPVHPGPAPPPLSPPLPPSLRQDNHLSGRRRVLLKLRFPCTQLLVECRNQLQLTVQRNSDRKASVAAYDGMHDALT